MDQYGNLGKVLADSLSIFSLDVVGIVASYATFLQPANTLSLYEFGGYLMDYNSLSTCNALAIGPDDILWRSTTLGIQTCPRRELPPEIAQNKHVGDIYFHKGHLVLCNFLKTDQPFIEFFYCNRDYTNFTYSYRVRPPNAKVRGVVLSSDGVIYTRSDDNIYKLATKGDEVKSFWCFSPTGFAMDSKGRLWISKSYQDPNSTTCITLYNNNIHTGTTISLHGTNVSRIRIDHNDNLYVCENRGGHPTVQVFNSSGAKLTQFWMKFGHITDIAIDRYNKIYVMDFHGVVKCYGFVSAVMS